MNFSDESFICHNCKTPLSPKATLNWVKFGTEPTCRECGDNEFDMYPDVSNYEPQGTHYVSPIPVPFSKVVTP